MDTMEKTIKQPSVAGLFYPADTVDLIKQIDYIKGTNRNFYKNSTRAVIVPHAGFGFSGNLAYEAINLLNRKVKNIFIFAPAHRVGFDGIALSSYEKWGTPLGEIELNQEIVDELLKKNGVRVFDDAFVQEHSVEVQVPFIQAVFDDVKIIPILMGKVHPRVIEEIIREYYPNHDNGFVISSDLSHFLNLENAKKLDIETANIIETSDVNRLRFEMACGAVGVAGLLAYTQEKKYTMIRVGLSNSFEVNSDPNSVVGYGSWFLYEGDKNELIGKYHSDFVIGLCKTVLESSFKKVDTTIVYPQVFDEPGASFVTIELDGQLRGCVGSVAAFRPLVADLIENTKNAAFQDPRFEPLKEEEFNRAKLSVSILTHPRRLFFKNEDELLDKIVPFLDGLVIKEGDKQALFLPSVWDQFFDKGDFLSSLKVKAGLAPDYFSDTLEVYRFETIYIKEE